MKLREFLTDLYRFDDQLTWGRWSDLWYLTRKGDMTKGELLACLIRPALRIVIGIFVGIPLLIAIYALYWAFVWVLLSLGLPSPFVEIAAIAFMIAGCSFLSKVK